MSTYLERPVFEFDINWSNPVNKSFVFDLKEAQIGFGDLFFTSLQNSVVQGWDISLLVSDSQAYDDFTSSLLGRLVGFWFPSPMLSAEFVSTISTGASSVFDIKYQGLSSSWNQHNDVYLFLFNDTDNVSCKITNVSDNGNGTERVTVNEDISSVENPIVFRLYYVRLLDDVEKGTFLAEGIQSRQIKVIELPEEYTDIETGAQSIYLYHLWIESPVSVDYFYTSFSADVVSGGNTYLKFPITHGSNKSNTKGDSENLDIIIKPDPANPLALYFPIALGKPMNVTVYEVQYSDLETQTLLFSGQVRTMEDSGEKMTAHCDSFIQILHRKVPKHLIGPICGYTFFDPNTCKVPRFQYQAKAIVQSVSAFNGSSAQRITASFNEGEVPPVTDFTMGIMQSGLSLMYSVRTIILSDFDNVLTIGITINAPAPNIQVGDSILVYPGCDGSVSMCKSRYDNFINFGGFPNIPVVNPSIASVNNNTAAGGKK